MEYEFTLKYQLDASDCQHDELVERLGAGGCDDAVIGIGQPRQIGFKFSRAAPSGAAAVQSALADIARIIPTASLIEAGPDFVGLTDVADLMGMSRQNLRKLMLAHPATFPLPVHGGSAGIWHLEELLQWLHQKEYAVDSKVIEVSATARHINVRKELQALPPAVRADLVRSSRAGADGS